MSNLFGYPEHQSKLPPEQNKFFIGNGSDGKHYWLTPPDLYAELDAEFQFDFDPCPFPLPEGFDGLTCEWGRSNYVNPPFGSIIHEGKKKGPTAWVRKAIAEWEKGKRVVLVYPVDKWVLMLMKAILGDHAHVRNLGDVKWLATEDGSPPSSPPSSLRRKQMGKLTRVRGLSNTKKEMVLLAIIASMRGQTDVSDYDWHWMTWFLEDAETGDDAFNRCINKGWLGSTYDSDMDAGTAFITPAGRAALEANNG